jgi:hypothetical protein
MPIVDRYPGPNRLKEQSGWGGGLGFLPPIQPAGMPSTHGGLAGLGQLEDPWYVDVSQSIVNIAESVTPIVEEGVDIYNAIDRAVNEADTTIRTTATVRRPAAIGGGMLLILGAGALLFMNMGGGKRGRRR